VYPNLRMHDRNYPTPDVLRSKIRYGRLGGQREFRQMSTATWGYGARGVVRPEFAHYLSAEWTRENVSSVGPFGAFYRVWGDGKQMIPGDIFDYFGLDLGAEELRAKGYRVWTLRRRHGCHPVQL
jgi:hypothetical protein